MRFFQPSRLLVAACALAFGGLGGEEAAAQTTRHVPGDFETITEAVAASQPGDTILVGPGIYKESLLFTETSGNGLIIKSEEGSAKTSIAYGEEGGGNEAVITYQRCTNSTQLVGFRIDGRELARRGILTNSDSKPVLSDIHVEGCEYGFAMHRGSRPFLRDVSARKSKTAGLFISGGSVDVKNGLFTTAEKFGVYIGNASDKVRLRNVRIIDNGQVGLQAAESEFSFEGGEVINNGDTGLILNETSPELSNLTISGHSNIGIVMEISSAVLLDSRITDNEFGAVTSIEGSPRIQRCVFERNSSYHLGIEGEARPLVGGSLANANQFLGDTDFRIQHSSSEDVVATYNYWDLPCSPKKFFEVSGGGKLRRRPWASGNLLRSFEDCALSRKYNKWFNNEKLDESGNHVKGRTLVPDDPAPGDDEEDDAGTAAASTATATTTLPGGD